MRAHREASSAEPPTRSRQRRFDRIGLEAGVIAVLTLSAVAAYVITRAPLYNPLDTIDPWLYTALWTNFAQTYHSFVSTYYVSRIPWIAPGYAVNLLFGSRTSYFIVHVTFFLAGGLLLYFGCRRWVGPVPAACAYIGLIGSQMYYNAHSWDYEEGAVLTFMIAAFAFVAPRTSRLPVRLLSLGLAGFFTAALVTTRITDVIYICGLPVFYWALVDHGRQGERLRRLALDLGAFVMGAGLLLVAGGIFASAHGGPFWYVGAQIKVARSTSGASNQQPFHLWFPLEPYFFAPFFVLVVSAVVLLVGPGLEDRARRFQIAATSWLALCTAIVVGWEFLGTGWVFEVPYYFSSLLPPMLFSTAGAVAGLVGSRRSSKASLAAVALSAAAVLGSLLWFYGDDAAWKTAHGLGSDSYVTALVIIAFGAIITVAARLGSRPLAVLSAAVLLLGLSFAVDGSVGTATDGRSASVNGDLYGMGQRMIGLLRQEGLGQTLPYFWYRVSDGGGVFGTLQSLYYYSYSFVGQNMPVRDLDFRSRMSQFTPSRLVLLCETPACDGAARSLTAGGFEPRLQARSMLHSGSLSMWVVVYRLLKPPTP